MEIHIAANAPAACVRTHRLTILTRQRCGGRAGGAARNPVTDRKNKIYAEINGLYSALVDWGYSGTTILVVRDRRAGIPRIYRVKNLCRKSARLDEDYSRCWPWVNRPRTLSEESEQVCSSPVPA